jgi:hypothetical protein
MPTDTPPAAPETKKYVPDVKSAALNIQRLFDACGDGSGKLDASWVMVVATKALEALHDGIEEGCTFSAVDFLPLIAPLVQRADSAETQYINLADLHRRTFDETEKTLLPEWQTVSDELARDGNSSWCSVMRGAVAMIRERAESAERERDAARDELKALGQAMCAAASVGGTKEAAR